MFGNNNNTSSGNNHTDKEQQFEKQPPEKNEDVSANTDSNPISPFLSQPIEKNYLYFFALIIKIAFMQKGTAKEKMKEVIDRFYKILMKVANDHLDHAELLTNQKYPSAKFSDYSLSMVVLLKNFQDEYFSFPELFQNEDLSYPDLSLELWDIVMTDISHHFKELRERIKYAFAQGIELDFVHSLSNQKERFDESIYNDHKNNIPINTEESRRKAFQFINKRTDDAFNKAESLYVDSILEEQALDIKINCLLKARELIKPITLKEKTLLANCDAELIRICYMNAKNHYKEDAMRALISLRMAYNYIDELELLNIDPNDLDYGLLIIDREKLCNLGLRCATFYFDALNDQANNQPEENRNQVNEQTDEHQQELLQTAFQFFEVASRLPNLLDSKKHYMQALLIKLDKLSQYDSLLYSIQYSKFSYLNDYLFNTLKNEISAIDSFDLDTKDMMTLAIIYKTYALILKDFEPVATISWTSKALDLFKSDDNIPGFIYEVPSSLRKSFGESIHGAKLIKECHDQYMELNYIYYDQLNHEIYNQLTDLNYKNHSEHLNKIKLAIQYLKNMATGTDDSDVKEQLCKQLYDYANIIYKFKIVIAYADGLSMLAQAKTLITRYSNDEINMNDVEELQKLLKKAFKEKNLNVQNAVNTIVSMFSHLKVVEKEQTIAIEANESKDQKGEQKKP